MPAQSLTLMNDPLVSKLANSWAQKTANQKDSRKRIEQMVEHAHGKIPSKETTDQLLAFVELQGKEYGKVDQRAWADLAHTLFNLKDFHTCSNHPMRIWSAPLLQEKMEKEIQRFGSVIGLNPKKRNITRDLHEKVWPEILEQIQQAGLQNFSIFITELEGKNTSSVILNTPEMILHPIWKR